MDAQLLAGKPVSAVGTYHLHFGRYYIGEEAERLAVRAAVTNGRPCAAHFRGMEEFRGKQPRTMWLQGITVGQGVSHVSTLRGAEVWYLVGILGDSGDLVKWASSASCAKMKKLLHSAIENIMSDELALNEMQRSSKKVSSHVDVGDIKLIRSPLWHEAVHEVQSEDFGRSPVEVDDVD